MKAKIVRIDKSVELPKYHTDESAGFDIASSEDKVIKSKEVALLQTGLIIQAPEGHFLLIAARSSLPIKKGLMKSNGIGIVDRDYCGPEDEVKLSVYNFTDHEVEVKKGDRIAQGLFLPVDQVEWFESDSISTESRGGFGSSGGYGKRKVYFGISGKILSGKSSAAKFFVEKFKAEQLRFSKVLDEILEILDLPVTRFNEQEMGVLVKELFGEEVISNALVQRALKSEQEVIVFEGLRKRQEIDFLKNLPGFRFIFVKADQKLRYDRMLQRKEKLNEESQTFEEFQLSETHEADKELADLERFADFIIVNEGSPEEFQSQLTKILTQSL